MRRFYSFIWLVCVGIAAMGQAPTTSENYVQTQVFRGPSASLPVTTIAYMDGLGRPVQSVIHRGNPQGKDLITSHQTYDGQGRQDKTYLPVFVNSQTGSFVSGATTLATNFYQDNTPFSQPVYEESSLNRVVSQYGAGDAWRSANRAVHTSYQVNTASEVRNWEVPLNGTLYSNEHYGEGELFKTVLTDEENHRTIEYKDKQGRVVEKRVQDGGTATTPTWIVTSYVYNDLGQLAYVIQPQLYANKIETASGQVTLSEQTDQAFLFAYHYDAEGRMTQKLVPGAGWTHMVYNKRHELILSQNARQAAESKWTFSKYDALGRMVLSGEITLSGQTHAQLQADAQGASFLFETRGNTVWGYTNQAYPIVTESQVHSVTYYDDYAWNSGSFNFVVFDNLTARPSCKGLPSGSKVRLLDESGQMLTSVIYYDDKNRPIQTHQQTPFGGTTRTDLSLSFVGEVLQKRVVYGYTDGKPSYTTLTTYEYDHMGRKTKTRHAVVEPGQTEETAKGVTLAEYVYDEIGRLKTKRIQPSENGYLPVEGPPAYLTRASALQGTVSDKAGQITLSSGFVLEGVGSYQAEGVDLNDQPVTECLQTMNYEYHIRGWLKGINQGTLNATENDLFGFRLHYEDQPGGLYNGNIHKQSWVSHSAKDAPARGYTYSYDAANRLTAAQYTGGKAGENYSLQGMQYDKNGNILALTRYGMTAGTPTAPTQFGVIDQLAYTYQQGNTSNQLAAVHEQNPTVAIPDATSDFRDRNTQGDDYEYYTDGSLKADKNKGIQSITYNYMGLVETVAVSQGTHQGTVRYVYDGGGRKWKKVVYDQLKQTTVQTHYDQEIQFEENKLSFILHEEGRVIPEPQTGKLAYEYHYKDHLGNLRVAFRQRSQTQTHANLTLEPTLAASEEASFEHVDESRAAGVAHSGRYAARVKQGIGPSKQIKLEAGEKLQANVYAHVEAEGKHRLNFLPLPVVGDVPVLGDDGKTKTRLAVKGGVLIPLNWGSKDKDQPAGYLEVVATDSSGKVVHAERKSLSNAALDSWEELAISYQAKGEETVTVQLVNPSEIAIVHFDDLTISQQPPLIVQENHYDPWGLNLVGIEVDGNPDHKYQYNGKEKQEELGLAWSDYGARMYDAQLGRWHVVDPLAEKIRNLPISPYAYTANNPISRIDPDGRDWFYYQAKGEERKTWHWQEGNKATYTNTKGKEVTTKKGYDYLVTYQTTGTNAYGATTGTITIFNQNKAVLTQKGVFTGAGWWTTAANPFKGGFDAAGKGNYMMYLGQRSVMENNQKVAQDQSNPKATLGIEQIPQGTVIVKPDGSTADVNRDYGNGRIRLNPVNDNMEYNATADRGYYLHGKQAWYGRTHGCVCDKTENVFNYFWSGGGKDVRTNTPFAIDVPYKIEN